MKKSAHVAPYEHIPFRDHVIQRFQTRFGQFPDDYFCIDIETSGLDRYRDPPVQIGVLPVKGRKPHLPVTHIINWFAVMTPSEGDWLKDRLRRTKAAIEARGKPYPWTPELIEERGEPPGPVAEAIRRVLGENPYCVGHYAWNFDFPRLYDFMAKYATAFDVYSERLYDTCLMTRAAIIDQSIPGGMEISNYYAALDAHRGAPSCKLGDCVDRFGLTQVQLATNATNADYDAWCAHLIFEKHREAAAE